YQAKTRVRVFLSYNGISVHSVVALRVGGQRRAFLGCWQGTLLSKFVATGVRGDDAARRDPRRIHQPRPKTRTHRTPDPPTTPAASHHRRGGLYSCRVAVRIRTAGDPADFSGAPGDPDDLGERVAAMWVAGPSRPECCFVAEDESGARVGRVGYRVEPTVTNPAGLGTLPPAELFPFGLWLPWQHGGCDLGRVLFASTLDRLANRT